PLPECLPMFIFRKSVKPKPYETIFKDITIFLLSSYLAEYSGFSSHSAFTTVFKSVTGMSPNVYIQEISKTKTV
ncbi:hypothetical protein BOQ60_26210, partial [Chryseobacterium sp. CH1]